MSLESWIVGKNPKSSGIVNGVMDSWLKSKIMRDFIIIIIWRKVGNRVVAKKIKYKLI